MIKPFVIELKATLQFVNSSLPPSFILFSIVIAKSLKVFIFDKSKTTSNSCPLKEILKEPLLISFKVAIFVVIFCPFIKACLASL